MKQQVLIFGLLSLPSSFHPFSTISIMSVVLPRDPRRAHDPYAPTPAPLHTHLQLPPAAGSYNGSDSKSKSFLNLTTSALSGVFGSHTSLSELAGDDTTETYDTKTSKNRTANYDRFFDNANKSVPLSITSSPTKPMRRGSMSFPSSISSTRRSTSVISRRASLPALTPTSTHRLVPLALPTLLARLLTLFAFGIAYGEITRHIHYTTLFTASTSDTANLLLWGTQGIVIGFVFPLFDWLFPSTLTSPARADWPMTIRAVFTFLGLGLGIRKLQMESSLQAAAQWGLMTPFVWYVLDGTRNGFVLSCLAAAVGTSAVLAVANQVSFTAAAWVASVFFCCSICVGNIGRRILAVEVAETRS